MAKAVEQSWRLFRFATNCRESRARALGHVFDASKLSASGDKQNQKIAFKCSALMDTHTHTPCLLICIVQVGCLPSSEVDLGHGKLQFSAQGSAMRRILFIYGVLNAGVGYVQVSGAVMLILFVVLSGV